MKWRLWVWRRINPSSSLNIYPIQGPTDQNRLVQDQAVRFGPRTRPDQDQKILRNLGPDRTRTKNFEKSRTESDQDRKNLRNPGPTRTRTRKFWEIQDQPGPRPENFGTSRTDSDQDQVDFRKPGSIRTGTKYAFHQYAENSPSPYSQSKVDGLLMNSSGSKIPGILWSVICWQKSTTYACLRFSEFYKNNNFENVRERHLWTKNPQLFFSRIMIRW